MAYTSAIFYMDLVSGSDTARTTFAPTAYANNGSGVVRVTKTTHGLVTGAIIDITGTTSNLYVGAWKITKIDNDNFDLDTSTFSSNPATKGTVAPRGGSSWTDAWKTITNGATAARIAPGDTIRIAKSADPSSIGNATWTNKSATVTLASAQTTNIYLDGSWTAANSGTATTTTTRKEGTNASSMTTAASTATATKYAYLTVGGASGLNLSSYDAITFWIQNASVAINVNNYQIKLCSDTTGDTAVDTFDIPAIASTGNWVPLTLTRSGGGALGNAIKSIAWYTGSSSPGNSRNVFIDDVLGCSSTGLNLTSLISKNSVAFDGADTWHGLQSINDTTVILGNENSLNTGSTSLKGYYTTGTTPETVTTYVRPTIKFSTMASSTTTNVETLQDDGTSGNLITYSGGWDTTTTTQNGETWIDGQNGLGRGISFPSSRVFNQIDRLNGCRFTNFITYNSGTEANDNTLGTIIITNCSDRGFGNPGFRNTINKLTLNNNLSGVIFPSGSPNTGYTIVSKLIMKNHSAGSSIGGYNHNWDELYVYNDSQLNYQSQGIHNINKLVVDSCTDNAFTTSNNSFFNIKDATITNNTNCFTNDNGQMYINKLTASGNTNLNYVRWLYVKQMNAATTHLIGSNFTVSVGNPPTQPTVFYSNVNNVVTDNRAYWIWGNALSQTTTRHTASGVAWQINITNTAQNINRPVNYPISKIACNANTLVTVKAWVKLSHATDIGAKLMIQANEIAGVSADVTATKTADTNWEELTITFTPTVAGVAQIYIQGYWLANLADESIYVDDITITQ